VTALDLDEAFKRLDSYNNETKSLARQEIRREFARLQLLEPQAAAYREIAESQARDIAILSTQLAVKANEPLAVSLGQNEYANIAATVHQLLVDLELVPAPTVPSGGQLS
jgi:hypothetical protein